MTPTRRAVLAMAGALPMLAPRRAAATAWPRGTWEHADAGALGWSRPRLDRFGGEVSQDPRSAVMVVQGGRLMAAFGDVARKVEVASVRKSIMSALYGIAVAERRIDPTANLVALGIDDRGSLSERERTATVRDLLMARSGVYHAAAHETPDMRTRRPVRGSHAPGTHFHYNNWDFNALGTIYERATGEGLFAAVERRIARPLGMEDFTAADGREIREAASMHPAHIIAFSARDLARFGLLYARGGDWKGRQIVPRPWVEESTRAHSDGGNGLGYGYLWWTMPARARAPALGRDAFFALGFGGHLIAVLPGRDLVVTRTVAPPFAGAAPPRLWEFLLGIVEAAPDRL
jgi:CubicO group peptidase (beta-lactamase class C family)